MALSHDLRNELNRLILPGFNTLNDVHFIVDDAGLADEYPDENVHAAADEIWQERKAQETSWDHPTGFERLSAAFEELHEAGVITAMNLGFDADECNQLVGDERTRIDVAQSVYPYREWASCAFHMQDAERLSEEPATLYLLFGAWFPGPAIADSVNRDKLRKGHPEFSAEWDRMDTALGRFIVSTLSQHGLETKWRGDPEDRIRIVNLEWRKSLPLQ